jgi:hypothetical protein
MKISGVKFGINIDVGEVDLDLKDCIDMMRLEHEHAREMRRECKDCRVERKLEDVKYAGPSANTKAFVEAIVNKAMGSIKEQIVEAIKSKGKKNKDDGDEN